MTGDRNRTEETEAAGTLPVGFTWLDPDGSADLPLPAYATSQAAGMDVAGNDDRGMEPARRLF
mgnify:CR=1 FL=1